MSEAIIQTRSSQWYNYRVIYHIDWSLPFDSFSFWIFQKTLVPFIDNHTALKSIFGHFTDTWIMKKKANSTFDFYSNFFRTTLRFVKISLIWQKFAEVGIICIFWPLPPWIINTMIVIIPAIQYDIWHLSLNNVLLKKFWPVKLKKVSSAFSNMDILF